MAGSEENADAYGDFAEVYDTLMDTAPYEAWCGRVVEFIEKYGISRPKRRQARADGEAVLGLGQLNEEAALASERDLVVDLGCGTGTLTQLLAEKGYDMIGVDNSPEMLGKAMEKKARSGADILYLEQDMRELELYGNVGTVVSVCDSLNYLLEEEELLRVFRLVNNYLYPGGIFVFDFNTEYKYETVIGDATIAENREECGFIWENTYDAETGRNEYDLTVFVREADGRFRRFTETHFQRGYTAERMKSFVEAAGMRVVELMDADTHDRVRPESERVYLVAKEYRKESKGSVRIPLTEAGEKS
ncbi:MAG: class I SAM-dependent methyltransferase [Clostridium sp.]|jgi:SAM-dependent methyltransferase|nr:class I SAM-dependent methyltransferase [Clostridium sp.]